jgi:predicted RNA-binding protein YlqC (UPF0109 family)
MLKPVLSARDEFTSTDYSELVKFLLQSFLDSPESLSIDCEQVNQNRRVWIRVAFEGEDKGKVYGRGGRNLQAIRSVLATAAAIAGQSLYLEIYENTSPHPKRRDYQGSSFNRKPDTRRHRPRHQPPSKFSPKYRD